MTTELPLDHTSVVLRDPHRFGDMQYNNQTKVVEIRLHRVPTELTREEKKYMLQCEREGRTLRARYQDINTKDMIRCPLESCNHTIINTRNLGNSIGVHFREHHSATNTSFVILYITRGEAHRVHHPDTLDEKQAEEKGWIPQEVGITEKEDTVKQPMAPSESTVKRFQQWNPTSGLQSRPHKPSTAIERYRQLTITEMMLKVRTPHIQRDSKVQNTGENGTGGNEQQCGFVVNKSGRQSPQPGSNTNTVAALENPVVGGDAPNVGVGSSAESECLRESLATNNLKSNASTGNLLKNPQTSEPMQAGFEKEVLQASPHLHISDTRK